MIGTDIRHHLYHSRETADRKQATGPTGHLGDLATSSQSFRVASRRKLARGGSPDRDCRCRREAVGRSQQATNSLKHGYLGIDLSKDDESLNIRLVNRALIPTTTASNIAGSAARGRSSPPVCADSPVEARRHPQIPCSARKAEGIFSFRAGRG